MTTIPIINMQFGELKEVVWAKLQEPRSQRKLILVIVSIALLLDNMLYMVIVPIIPDYLRYIGAYTDEPLPANFTPGQPVHKTHHGQDQATGVLFASKAIVQLMINPFSGALIDRIGYDIPMMIGLTIMFLSTAVFACGRSYGLLFFARSLQGVGSAFADTSGLAMIADRFTEENERSKALGIALAFISFGCLVAPPFGGALYQFAGKEVPFLILAFVSLMDGFMLLLVMKPLKQQQMEFNKPKPPTIPIWRLFIDPYIAVCSGALMMSNVALAFLEPTISLWMEDNLTTDNWKIGMIWLPAFFPHVLGVIITVKMAKQYPQHQWLMAAGGLALEGLCCFIIPFSSSYKMLMIPICGICFGIALIDTALLPTLGYLVDVRYVSVYGSIYAIADISYCVAYAVGPIIAGGVVEAIGFTALNIGIAFSNLLYAPVLYYLHNIYDFKPFENEANILMSDPPNKEYQTYSLQDQKPVSGEFKNHLEYSRYQEDSTGGMQETNVDQYQGYQTQDPYQTQYQQQPADQNYSYQAQGQGYQATESHGYQAANQGYQAQGYQETSYQQQQPQQGYQDAGYQRQQPAVPQQRQLPQQPADVNPFRRPEQQPPAAEPQQGWRDSLLSLPKKWLSGTTVGYSKDVSSNNGANALPKLPVPPLEQTMERYLVAMQPVVSAPQLERTKQIVKAFSAPGAHGTRLQQYLMEQQNLKDNWAYDYWINDMYYDVPIPLVVNSNPGMVFPPRKFTTVHDVARFAARMIDGILDHKDILDRKELPVERAKSHGKDQPLCMAQYYRLLTSCRIPGKVRDTLYSRLSDLQETPGNPNEHVIVACRNQFYCVPVKADDRGRLNEDEICSQFVHILNDAPCLASPPPVGLLTGENRRKWAEVRETLYQNNRNRRNLDLISKSLVIVCLDEALPASFNSRALRASGDPVMSKCGAGHTMGLRDETNMAHHMIHGGGSSLNSANRWFDKTIQLVISNDGVCGICYEHSPSEGIAVIQLMEELLKRCEDMPPGSAAPPTTSSCLPPPERLEWQLDSRAHRSIQEAAQTVDCVIEDLDFCVYRFAGYGKNFIKSCQVSPDAYIQLALQLAYFRLYGHLVTTYESAGTRRFLLGRVDCIRSATQEALNWATAMCQGEGGTGSVNEGDASDEELLSTSKKVTFSLYTEQKKLEFWEAAIKRQTEVMLDAINGQGIDIHLLGLREAARDTAPTAAHPLPEIFTDETYRIANAFLLSTSQVSTTTDSFMGYGPVVPDGYGASYNIKPDTVIFCLSSFHSSDLTSTWKFAHSLEESLLAMQNLLSNAKSVKK